MDRLLVSIHALNRVSGKWRALSIPRADGCRCGFVKNPMHLFPLYTILFTMPGVPSVYYGSEWGIKARRSRHSDMELRPCMELEEAARSAPVPELARYIGRLAGIRRSHPALYSGDYRQLHVSNEQFAFMRQADGESVVVAVNAAAQHASVRFPAPFPEGTRLSDVWNAGAEFEKRGGTLSIEVPANSSRILKYNGNLPILK